MVGNLLLRGMLVGVVAGLLAFGFARTFGVPQIDRAIAFEEKIAQAKGEAPEPELVSRETQTGLGLVTGTIVYSAAIGGLFSLVFAFVYGRVGRMGVRATAGLLALGAFVAVVLVPSIKYPANPPAIGEAETIGHRTGLFVVMLVISVVALVLAVMLARGLWAQYSALNATLIAGAAFVAVIALAQYMLPTSNEVPEQFPADVLWQFRAASLGTQVVLWATIGLLFGPLSERILGQGVPARR